MRNLSPNIIANVNLCYIEPNIYGIHEEFEIWLQRLNKKQKDFIRFQKVLKICYGLLYDEIINKMRKNDNFEVFWSFYVKNSCFYEDFVYWCEFFTEDLLELFRDFLKWIPEVFVRKRRDRAWRWTFATAVNRPQFNGLFTLKYIENGWFLEFYEKFNEKSNEIFFCKKKWKIQIYDEKPWISLNFS